MSLAFAATLNAAPATQLVVSNDPCLIQACPQPPSPPPKIVAAGKPFPIFVAALDAGFAIDSGYRGTVTLTSTDSLATLVPPYTFLAADQGGRGFIIVLRSPGPQTITAIDASGNLTPGSLTITVTGSAPLTDVPTLTAWISGMLMLLLGSAGVWLTRAGK
jgi:hypothetical protein